MDDLQHECGIAALYHLHSASASALTPLGGPDQVSRLMPRVLLDLQNRGQLAAGFTTYNSPPPPRRRTCGGSSPAGPRSATSATPPAARTPATTPSRSSGRTGASGSGS